MDKLLLSLLVVFSLSNIHAQCNECSGDETFTPGPGCDATVITGCTTFDNNFDCHRYTRWAVTQQSFNLIPGANDIPCNIQGGTIESDEKFFEVSRDDIAHAVSWSNADHSAVVLSGSGSNRQFISKWNFAGNLWQHNEDGYECNSNYGPLLNYVYVGEITPQAIGAISDDQMFYMTGRTENICVSWSVAPSSAAQIISSSNSGVTVRPLSTNEEVVLTVTFMELDRVTGRCLKGTEATQSVNFSTYVRQEPNCAIEGTLSNNNSTRTLNSNNAVCQGGVTVNLDDNCRGQYNMIWTLTGGNPANWYTYNNGYYMHMTYAGSGVGFQVDMVSNSGIIEETRHFSFYNGYNCGGGGWLTNPDIYSKSRDDILENSFSSQQTDWQQIKNNVSVNEADIITLYPNPVHPGEPLIINLKEGHDFTGVSIFSISGSKVGAYVLVSSNGQLSIETNNFASGVYLLRFTDTAATVTTKRVVIHNR